MDTSKHNQPEKIMAHETELQIRLRRAKEAMAYAAEKESEARRLLRSAEELRRVAKEKYENLFIEEEWAEVGRRKAAHSNAL